MAGVALTKRSVDAAKPASKDQFVWDSEVSGFGLKVTPAGSKVYVYQYRIARPGQAERTSPLRYTIGKHGNLTPDQARKRAKELAGLVDRGIDPRQQELEELAAKDEADRQAQEKARVERDLAFDKVAALWLDHYEHEKGRRPSSLRLARTVVNRHLIPKLLDKPIPHIGRAQLQPIIDAIPVRSKGMRRAVFAYASVLFGWAAKRGDIAANPVTGMAKPEAPKSRDRVLTDDELAAIWTGSETLAAPFRPFFRLLILTGQRRSEVAEMSWSELDRKTATWTIPADRTKNHAAHIVPLNDLALDELASLAEVAMSGVEDAEVGAWPKSGWVLTTTGDTAVSGFTKAKKGLDAAITKARRDKGALPDWRIHDLRRSLATGFQRLGIRFEVTEATLNHISGARGGIAGVYQRHDWKNEKCSALEAWGRHIAAILKPVEDGKVVPLHESKRRA